MNILCLFAGQGYQDDDLFLFFQNHPEAKKILLELSYIDKIDLLNPNCSLKSPYFAQYMITAFHFCIFNFIAPLLSSHQVNLAGYSLGEVSAFLASVGATHEELYQTIAFRTALMTSLIPMKDKFEYDLLSIRGPLNLEEMKKLCRKYHCEVAIINSEQHIILAGRIKDLKLLLANLSSIYLSSSHFLEIHLPSHTPFYANKKGMFAKHLDSLFFQELNYPILSPLELCKIYNTEEEKKLLDKELYTTLEWFQLCKLISEYQYDLIIDLGPGDSLSKQLKALNIHTPVFTFAHYKHLRGALTDLKKRIH